MCHYVAKAGRTRCEYCKIMTPGGYWPPSLRAEIGDFGSDVSCSFCPLRGFLFGKTCQSPSLIAEHFPGTVTYFTTCSLWPPFSVCTFDLLPKSDNVVTFYQFTSTFLSTFYLPPPPPNHCLCSSPTFRVALAPFHQKIIRPDSCFYHTSPLVFITFSLPPSATETTFTLPQFGRS